MGKENTLPTLFYPIIFIGLCFILAACDSTSMQPVQSQRLERIDTIQNGEIIRQEVYHYNEMNQLVEVEDASEDGFRQVIEYEGERVVQILRYENEVEVLTFKDSLAYNDLGRVETHYNVSYNWGTGERASTHRFDIEYDNIGRIRRMVYNSGIANDRVRTEELVWDGAKVERSNVYWNGQLSHIFFYTYDDKINYRRPDPRYLTNPVYGGAHNVTLFSSRDYTGLLDIACNPCEWKYEYNRDGFPVLLKSESHVDLRFHYREVESEL